MGRQRRKSAQILSTIEQRRLKLEEEIRNLESQPESPARNRQLSTKKRLLLNVDKERYNWMGLEDDEELGTQHFIKNVQAVIRQRRAGLAESIKGAIGMKILGSDPLISNAWAGGLMLRDMFRGRTEGDADLSTATADSASPVTPGADLSTTTADSASPVTPGGDTSDSNQASNLLSQIADTSDKTFDLLNWVYTYRRARFREIMNLDNIKDAAIATTAQQALPPGEFQERLTDRDNDVENKVTDLIELTKEGLFGSPKLLGPAGPIAGLLEKVHEGVLIQGDAINKLEPTEEETREAQMGRLGRLNEWSKDKKLSSLAKMGATAGTAAGGLSPLAQEVIGEAGGQALYKGGAVAAGAVGKTIAKVVGSTGLKLVGLAGTAVVMAGMDAAKGWIYKHKAWNTSRTSATVASAVAGTGDRGIVSAFANMGKWAAAGAAIGMIGGPPGMIAGGLIGAALGGVFAWIGGQKIANWIDDLSGYLSAAIFDKTSDNVHGTLNLDSTIPARKFSDTDATTGSSNRLLQYSTEGTPEQWGQRAEEVIKRYYMEGLIGPQTGGAGGDKVIIDSSSKQHIENTLISNKISAEDKDRPIGHTIFKRVDQK